MQDFQFKSDWVQNDDSRILTLSVVPTEEPEERLANDFPSFMSCFKVFKILCSS